MTKKQNPSMLVGKRGEAEVIEIFAAVTNTELNEGSGVDVDASYHETPMGARLGAVQIGVMGSDGKVEPRLAVRFVDGTILLLAGKSYQQDDLPMINFKDEKDLLGAVQRRALSKLSNAEREALGLSTTKLSGT